MARGPSAPLGWAEFPRLSPLREQGLGQPQPCPAAHRPPSALQLGELGLRGKHVLLTRFGTPFGPRGIKTGALRGVRPGGWAWGARQRGCTEEGRLLARCPSCSTGSGKGSQIYPLSAPVPKTPALPDRPPGCSWGTFSPTGGQVGSLLKSLPSWCSGAKGVSRCQGEKGNPLGWEPYLLP